MTCSPVAVEARVANESAKAECLSMDLGSRTFATTGVDDGFSAGLPRFGLNDRF